VFAKKITNPVETAKQAAADYQACYGDNLVTIILYGSACSREFNPVKSDINLLIVLKEASLEMMEKAGPVLKKWAKFRVQQPLIMDMKYISHSLDTFPIEFLNMRFLYMVLAGEDFLKDLNLEKKYIRLQLERELKGKRLRLAMEWISVKNKPELVQNLVRVSLNDFAAVFRALLFLKGVEIPAKKADIFTETGKAYALEDRPFKRILEALGSNNRKEIVLAFPAYASAIVRLEEIIDQENEKETV